MKHKVFYAVVFFLLMAASLLYYLQSNQSKQFIKDKVQNDDTELLKIAAEQMKPLVEIALEENNIPRTVNEEGKIEWINKEFDWTEGFFPGSCWYFYEFSKDDFWKTAAETLQSLYENQKSYTDNHDLGFVFNCSYGNGYRLTNNPKFKEVLLEASESLITRFNSEVGCIQSWDVDKDWQAKRNWEFPVIIDNMMNLELLFVTSELSGDKRYKDIAVTHANTTLKNHFRDDYSSYHVVDYNPETGEVRKKETAQGYAHYSAWARGQAWGLYGYTVCYRYTKNRKYLDVANNIADFIIGSFETEGVVPNWDYDAPESPTILKDASAAAITASALVELNTYTQRSYEKEIRTLIDTLSSDTYMEKDGGNKNFILKHSVGSIPHNSELNVPLNYADYYFIEALIRLKRESLN